MIIEEYYMENYEITLCGKIINKKTGLILSQSKMQRGYLSVTLNRNGLYKTFYVHRLVALNYIQNPKNKPLVNHKNGNKHDNRVSNLEWMTAQENSLHSVQSLKKEVGEAHSRCRLPNHVVIAIILNQITENDFDYIAKKYGISIQHLKNIKAGRKRKSIELFA